MTAKKIRIITWGGIGDAILLTPLLREIKAREPHIQLKVYCIEKDHQEVLRHNPHIDVLRRARFGSAPLEYVLYLWRPKRFFTPNYSDLRPSLFYQKQASAIIAEMFGVSLTVDACPEIFLTSDEEASARRQLDGVRNPVALHASARSSINRQWPKENWAELVRRNRHLAFCQLGVVRDEHIPGTYDFRGKLSLRQSFALLKSSVAFVGTDSALAHAAAAFRTPAVVLFGASTPTIWGHPENINLYKALRCSPCIDVLCGAACPYSRRCMTDLSVAEAERALLNLLSVPHLRDQMQEFHTH